MTGSPNAGNGGTLHVILKVTRRTTEGALHTVGYRLVTSVQHRAEQVEDEFDHVVRHMRLDQRIAIRIRRDRQESNVASGCESYFFDRRGKCEGSWSGELIE